MHTRIPADLLHILLHHFRVIRIRNDIRHCHNRRKSSGSGSHRAGSDGFFILISRFTQMHMDIDQTRQKSITFSINDLCLGTVDLFFNRENLFFVK